MEFALRDGQSPSYGGSVSGLVGVTGDILTFTAPTTYGKVMRLIRICTTAVATAATDTVLTLLKRSTLDTGGTGTAVATCPYNPGGNTATTVVTSYTAAPTPGTIIGTAIRCQNLTLALASTGQSSSIVWDFGQRPSQAPSLYAPTPSPLQAAGVQLPTTQICLAVSSTVSGAAYYIDFEFTEDVA